MAAEAASTARRSVIASFGIGAPAPPDSPARSSGSNRCRRPESPSAVASASTASTAAPVAAGCFLSSALQCWMADCQGPLFINRVTFGTMLVSANIINHKE